MISNCGNKLMTFLFLFLVSTGIADAPRESQIKAAFLYNFTQFVSWPAQTFSEADSPMVIGVVGSDPFGSDLDDTIAGKTVGNRKLTVKRLSSEDATCHILFVATQDVRRRDTIIEKLHKIPVLTVGNGIEFAKSGGMIGFYLQDNRVKLAINVMATQNAGLNVSSQLLRISNIVRQ